MIPIPSCILKYIQFTEKHDLLRILALSGLSTVAMLFDNLMIDRPIEGML